MVPLLIILIYSLKFTNSGVNEDIVIPDYPLDWKTEEERVQHQWNDDKKKWFDYIFDPHYDVTTYTLTGGTEIPALGINTKTNDNLYESLVFAMRLGYRYIHTSLSYNNYPSIARAISTVGVRRSSIFLSLKIDPSNYGYKSTINAVKTFLKQIEYKNINLCLMGGPQVPLNDDIKPENKLYESAKIRRATWMALESLQEDGVCLNLGVAYFEKKHLEELMYYAKYKPSTNMIEYHPYNIQKKLKKYMVRNGMIVISDELLNPTSDNALLKDKVIRDIAIKYAKTPAQIILKWAMQQAIIALPSDNRKQRIADNGQIIGFELEYNDIYKINKLNKDVIYGNSYQNVEVIQWNKTLDKNFKLFFLNERQRLHQERVEKYKAYRESMDKQEL